MSKEEKLNPNVQAILDALKSQDLKIEELRKSIHSHEEPKEERKSAPSGDPLEPSGHDAHTPTSPNTHVFDKFSDAIVHAKNCPNCRPELDKDRTEWAKETLGLTDHDLEEVECVGCGKKVKRITPKCPTCGNAEIGKHT